MKLNLNMLIEWTRPNDKAPRRIERVLHIERTSHHVITIDVHLRKAWPIRLHYDDIVEALETGDARVLTEEPFPYIFRAEPDIPNNYKERRDRAFQIVGAVLEKGGSGIYYRRERGKAITEGAKEFGVARKEIYRYLQTYWQRGCVKNALLPKFHQCAIKGQRFAATESEKKLGRKSNVLLATGQESGRQLTVKDFEYFRKIYEKHYLKRTQITLEYLYQRLLGESYNTGYNYEDVTGPDGTVQQIEIPIILPAEQLPTIGQFSYRLNRYIRNPEKEYKARYGEGNYNLSERILYGDSTKNAFGPGALFQIDATLADLYLLSHDRSTIIGKPILYFVVDVFSRMIVGFAITLEGPSWTGAMLALDNVMADKVAYCKSFGISIESWQWPCQDLPEAILADRGEFEGYNPDILVNVLGIRIQNTAPYRGDLKAIVERQFEMVNGETVKFIPGSTKRRRDRGEKRPDLDASLTLQDFRSLMIRYILKYNQHHKLTWYRRSESQARDKVALKPIAIWQWGIENGSGQLRSFPRELVRMCLLPRKPVGTTRYGIRFFKRLYYELPPTVVKVGRGHGITVAYDPQNMSEVYVPSADNASAFVCPLTSSCSDFMNYSLSEIEEVFELESIQSQSTPTQENQTKAKFDAVQTQFIEEAVRKTKEVRELIGQESDRARRGKIRKSRSDERERERGVNAFNKPASPPHPDAGGNRENLSLEGDILVNDGHGNVRKPNRIKPPTHMEAIKKVRLSHPIFSAPDGDDSEER